MTEIIASALQNLSYYSTVKPAYEITPPPNAQQGQTAEQQSTDDYACFDWAKQFKGAYSACIEGRGYSVNY